MNHELEGIWKEAGAWPSRGEKSRENLSEDNRCTNLESNRVPPETPALPLHELAPSHVYCAN
jgi:hypothetical protein